MVRRSSLPPRATIPIGRARSTAGALLLVLATGCGVDPVGPAPDPGDDGDVVFLVGDPAHLNASENGVRDVLTTFGREIRILEDDGFRAGDETGCVLVVVSKSVTSGVVGDELRETECGVLTWEDDQQRIDMLATITDDGSNGSSWHTRGSDVWVHGGAPGDLRAALSGPRDFYDRTAEISYAPRGTLIEDAIVIATLGEPDGRAVVYVVPTGARLADGEPAAGRRAFFGLHHDTYRWLTADGRALFAAVLRWTMAGTP